MARPSCDCRPGTTWHGLRRRETPVHWRRQMRADADEPVGGQVSAAIEKIGHARILPGRPSCRSFGPERPGQRRAVMTTSPASAALTVVAGATMVMVVAFSARTSLPETRTRSGTRVQRPRNAGASSAPAPNLPFCPRWPRQQSVLPSGLCWRPSAGPALSTGTPADHRHARQIFNESAGMETIISPIAAARRLSVHP